VSDSLIVLRLALVRLGFAVGSRLPLLRRVVLATAHAEHIGGNLAAIREKLHSGHPDIEVVILAHRPGRGLRTKLVAAMQAVAAGYQLGRARLFVVDDYFFPIYAIRPRRGTTIVQTWHASGAFKKMGYSLAGKQFGADASLLRRVRIHSNYDVCLISSMHVLPHYVDAFRLPPDRFTSRVGVPRTDVLLAPDADARATAVRERHGIAAGRRVVLYAPTFRGDRITDARTTRDLDLRVLHAALGDDHVLLLRLHPFVRSAVEPDSQLDGFVVDVSDHSDVNELLLCSDVLVTDYSSIIYDFSLLGRPMVFFTPDRAAYERERGFYFDYDEVPGPIFDTTPPLATYLRDAEFDVARVEQFARNAFDVADGQATQRFVDRIVLPALTGTRTAA
jgi:teichoic acid ribitol-phosphate primase